MNTRVAKIGGTAMLVAVAAAAWFSMSPARLVRMPALFQSAPPEADIAVPAADTDDDGGLPLPLPPIPPRIASGADYEKCMGMLATDPAGANEFAANWLSGGAASQKEGAAHCQGLAQIALGNPERGATQLEALAAGSNAPEVARAVVYDQAVQAWMMANNPTQAYAAATHAIALAPEDAGLLPDLLIDRAMAAANLTHYMDAIDDLTRALDLDGNRADALVFRAAAWRRSGQLALAQDDVDRALAIDADNPDALLEHGILRQRQGDRRAARADWERCIELDPNGPTADMAEQNLALLAAGPKRR
jgi:tetratricopeptide (TPR) repeat protein